MAEMAEGVTPTNGAHGREEDLPSSPSTKRVGKAIQEEHDGSASSTKPIPNANADKMKRVDMDDSLKSSPVPKKTQQPKILSYLNDTRDHSPSRDEGRDHDPRTSNCGHDDNTHTGESSISRSTGVVREGITSPCAAELAKGTAAASSSMKSVIPDGPSIEENVNSSLRGPSSSTPSPTKAVRDAPGSPAPAPINGGGIAVIAARLAPAQPNVPHQVPALAPINGGGIAVIAAPPGPAQPNVPRQVPALAPINGGGIAVLAAPPGPGQPNVPRQVPALAPINGGGIAVIAAHPAPAQLNVGGLAPNFAPPVPILPPNPRLNNIDEVLINSSIRPLRNPVDGDDGKLWDKLN